MTAHAPRTEGRDLRQALIDAASAMLQEARPAPALSLRAVARACNVSPTAVYLHFESFSALIDAVLTQHFADARAHVLSAARAAIQPRERLRATALAYVTWGLEHSGPYQLLFESIDWVKNTHEISAWMAELVESMADDLVTTRVVRDRTAAIDRIERLLTALHGIVSIRRRKGNYTWRHTATEEAAGMVDIFAAPRRGTPKAH